MTDYCHIAAPITADLGCDTQTLNSIAKHNEKFYELCRK